MNPLYQAYRAVVRSAGGAASGLWEVDGLAALRDKIKDRYPFNLAATRDASFEDAVAFFKPKDGILWGFYDKYLKDFHRKVNHDFVPCASRRSTRASPGREGVHAVQRASTTASSARTRSPTRCSRASREARRWCSTST
jgi:type VI protein secretion system component VasK